MWVSEMVPNTAEDVIEQLRFGIPPSGASLDFTVGRDSQIDELVQSLERTREQGALLIHANYGAGKEPSAPRAATACLGARVCRRSDRRGCGGRRPI